MALALAWFGLLASIAHPWPVAQGSSPLTDRLAPPKDFRRIVLDADSFGTWLRALPVRPPGWPVHLFDGRLKSNQSAHVFVLDVDVGRSDLQQCADAVIRLRAEYLFAADRTEELCFRFTRGDAVGFEDWTRGVRFDPKVSRGRGADGPAAAPPTVGPRRPRDYESFRSYLELVFRYAGTASLARDLDRVKLSDPIEAGDVFVQGGFPGHAVMVVDVAENRRGDRVFALVQSFMPAQEIHVLSNPLDGSPWFTAEREGDLVTPEWTFRRSDRVRFRGSACD